MFQLGVRGGVRVRVMIMVAEARVRKASRLGYENVRVRSVWKPNKFGFAAPSRPILCLVDTRR